MNGYAEVRNVLVDSGFKPQATILKEERATQKVYDQAKEDRHRRSEQAQAIRTGKTTLSSHAALRPRSCQESSKEERSPNRDIPRSLQYPDFPYGHHHLSGFYKSVAMSCQPPCSTIASSSTSSTSSIRSSSKDRFVSPDLGKSLPLTTSEEITTGSASLGDELRKSDSVKDRIRYHRVPDNAL